jgi:hypothetical protein
MLVEINSLRDPLDTIHSSKSERHRADAGARHELEAHMGISGKTRGRRARGPETIAPPNGA